MAGRGPESGATRAAIKGRGAVSSPSGRFEKIETVQLAETGQHDFHDEREHSAPQTVVRSDHAKSILSRNSSPDIPSELSANPYRGCEHGCVYCFARPSHAWLGLSPGLDFETRIFAKRNAAELLRAELGKPGYRPAPLSLGINTDAYQPAERNLQITRAMLRVLQEARHPVSLITKSALVERDLDLLQELAADNLAEVAISITTLDRDLCRRLEPRAATPSRRLRTIGALAAADIPVSVLMAPIIPAVTDHEIESLLAAAADAGTSSAGYVVLRLPHELKEVFNDWLDEHLPLRAKKVRSILSAMHGGNLYNARFFTRQRGTGPFARLIADRFAKACAAANLGRSRLARLRTDLFRPPPPQGQSTLF